MEQLLLSVLNVHGVNEARQTEMHNDHSSFEGEFLTEKLKGMNHQILIKFQQN
jgi:hypothetical protein